MSYQKIAEFIKQEQLPASYCQNIDLWFQDLADDLAALQKKKASTLIVGLQGLQGSGKSTLAKLLICLLSPELSVVTLSLDDFYLPRQQRQRLAEQIHPLLAIRGVPGTHDVALALACIEKLQRQNDDGFCLIPRFDKSRDDRLPESQWQRVVGSVDLIILEGWCVGAEPQTAEQLLAPMNNLEKNEDAEAVWRNHVNDCLAAEYQMLFKKIEYLLLLNPPSFEMVYEWRLLQEQKLSQQSDEKNRLMNKTELRRFIDHFERLTRHCLQSLPQRAERVFELNVEHNVVACRK